MGDEPMPFPPGTRDVQLLAWTYPWWRRPFTWLAWHTPVIKQIMGAVCRVNPYRRVIAVIDARSVAQGMRRGKG